MMNKIIVGALGLVASVAATPLELAERSSCRDDSLYKCFADREYSHSASAYCSALTPVTQTVSVTKPTVTKTVWVTSTAPASTDFISSTTTVYTTTVPSSTETATSTATETVTTTTTVTGAQQPPQTQAPPPPITTTMIPEKRIVQGGKPQPPKCMLTKCFVYSPERITAGCSCIGVPPKTVTVSQTAPCSTITVTSTSTTTPQVTATAWQTVVTELANGVSTTTTTVTATATTTTIVTATPPAQNLIPNGDFSSGVTGWTVINTSPASWVNAGVTTNNSPDGTSKNFQVTNVIANGQFFLASPMFGLKVTSSYSLSFLIATTSTNRAVVNSAQAQLNCGSITVTSVTVSRATQGPGSYLISTTAFNTPISSDPNIISQLNRCQLQILLPSATPSPITWFLADMSLTSGGALSP